jgi:hypothetical protein
LAAERTWLICDDDGYLSENKGLQSRTKRLLNRNLQNLFNHVILAPGTKLSAE